MDCLESHDLRYWVWLEVTRVTFHGYAENRFRRSPRRQGCRVNTSPATSTTQMASTLGRLSSTSLLGSSVPLATGGESVLQASAQVGDCNIQVELMKSLLALLVKRSNVSTYSPKEGVW